MNPTISDKPSLFSYIAGYWILSSAKIVGDNNATATSRLFAGGSLAAGAYAFYYVAGNPIELVQDADFVPLAFGYAAATVTGFAVTRVGDIV